MTKRADLQKLIQDIVAAKREYFRLVFDEDDPSKPGEPATPDQIARLERRFGRPLPPSYRAFLELHNGWDYFGGGKLLRTDDHDTDWVRQRLDVLATNFKDVDEENPVEEGGLAVLLKEDETGSLILDPRTARPDGEMDFVKYRLGEEGERFSDFTAFLRNDLESDLEAIKEEKDGLSDDEGD